MNKLVIEDLPHYNYDDYKLWEDDWELIRSIPYAMSPAPGSWHQDFGSNFIRLFQLTCKKRKAYLQLQGIVRMRLDYK